MKLGARKVGAIVIFSFLTHVVCAAQAEPQISDCILLANQVTQVVDAKLRATRIMGGDEVNQIQPMFPAISHNHLQFYISAAAISWPATGGDVEKVYQKTLDNCNRHH